MPSLAEPLTFGAKVVHLFDRHRSLNQLCHRLLAFDVQESERRVGRSVPIGYTRSRRLVPYREILQSPLTVQADTPGSESSEWHSDLEKVLALELSL
jgi:hypothetical protein